MTRKSGASGGSYRSSLGRARGGDNGGNRHYPPHPEKSGCVVATRTPLDAHPPQSQRTMRACARRGYARLVAHLQAANALNRDDDAISQLSSQLNRPAHGCRPSGELAMPNKGHRFSKRRARDLGLASGIPQRLTGPSFSRSGRVLSFSPAGCSLVLTGWSPGPARRAPVAGRGAPGVECSPPPGPPEPSLTDCAPCAYAREHGWWGPAHRGTHCRDCHHSWTSRKEAHCTVCHEHFASVTAAEMHWCDGRGKAKHSAWCDCRHSRPWAPKHIQPSEVPGLALGEHGWCLARLVSRPRTPGFSPANRQDGESAQSGPEAA